MSWVIALDQPAGQLGADGNTDKIEGDYFLYI